MFESVIRSKSAPLGRIPIDVFSNDAAKHSEQSIRIAKVTVLTRHDLLPTIADVPVRGRSAFWRRREQILGENQQTRDQKVQPCGLSVVTHVRVALFSCACRSE